MITPNQLSETIIKLVVNHEARNSKVINVNNKDLSKRGDLSFQLGLNYWRGYINTESKWFKNSKNILYYFMHRCLNNQDSALNYENNNLILLEMLKKQIIEKLEQIYNTRNLNTQLLFNITNNFVLINFNRSIVSYIAIKTAVHQDFQFGKQQNCKNDFFLKVEFDDESELTNMRLNLLKKVSSNLLKFQNHNINKEECNNNYIFTIRSEGNIDASYNRYLCGAVLNSNKKKERIWTQDVYFQRKLKKIEELNAQKYSDAFMDKNSIEKDAQKLTNASIAYELLSVKHSSPVIIENSEKLDNSIKEAAFILYNNVRISAILNKYIKSVEENNLPEIISIEKFESFHKLTDEDSWSLIYNYIIKYPDVLKTVVKIEPKFDINIQLLWSFICNLCHDFSKYYRKNKILIIGGPANDQIINLTTERLYMLKALQIVLRNSLSLLDIDELKSM